MTGQKLEKTIRLNSETVRIVVKVLATIDECYLISKPNNFLAAGEWLTWDEIENQGYILITNNEFKKKINE